MFLLEVFFHLTWFYFITFYLYLQSKFCKHSANILEYLPVPYIY